MNRELREHLRRERSIIMKERYKRCRRLDERRLRMAKKESIAWEHSEPGSGPTPVYSDPNKDKSIKSGSRIDSPPAAYNPPQP